MRLEANIDSELNVPVRLTDVHSSSAIEVCSQELALDDLPNDLTRMLYLASLRDCNSGRYLHPQFSQKLGGEEADHAIGACPTLGSLCRRTDRLIGRSRKACHANTRTVFCEVSSGRSISKGASRPCCHRWLRSPRTGIAPDQLWSSMLPTKRPSIDRRFDVLRGFFSGTRICSLAVK